MRHDERIEVFDRLRAKYLPLLTAVLWRLTGDREIFAEARQDALLGMWRHVEKLEGANAHGYISSGSGRGRFEMFQQKVKTFTY